MNANQIGSLWSAIYLLRNAETSLCAYLGPMGAMTGRRHRTLIEISQLFTLANLELKRAGVKSTPFDSKVYRSKVSTALQYRFNQTALRTVLLQLANVRKQLTEFLKSNDIEESDFCQTWLDDEKSPGRGKHQSVGRRPKYRGNGYGGLDYMGDIG